MKIVMLLGSWGGGGLERHAIELANAMSARHEVHVICHLEQPAHSFLSTVHLHPVNMARSRLNPLFYRHIARVINQIAPDVVHAQASKAAILLARARPFLLPGIRTVASMHNQKKTLWPFKKMDAVILGGNEGLLGGKTLGVPTHTIYNGIVPTPVNDWTRGKMVQEFGFDPNRPVYCAVGRCVEAKDFASLVTAVGLANQQCLLIGDGPLLDDLRKQAEVTGACIKFAGYRADAMSLLAVSDGMLVSSVNEGFAYVFVEGLLARRPILSTRLPMTRDFLPDSLQVEPGQPEAFASRLSWLSGHPSEWAGLMEHSWQKAASELTLDRMTSQIEQVYITLLSGPSPVQPAT